MHSGWPPTITKTTTTSAAEAATTTTTTKAKHLGIRSIIWNRIWNNTIRHRVSMIFCPEKKRLDTTFSYFPTVFSFLFFFNIYVEVQEFSRLSRAAWNTSVKIYSARADLSILGILLPSVFVGGRILRWSQWPSPLDNSKGIFADVIKVMVDYKQWDYPSSPNLI